MGINEDILTGNFLPIGALEALISKRKEEALTAREDVRKKQARLTWNSPRANLMTLAKGIRLIAKEYPEAAQLLNAIIILTFKRQVPHDKAIEIIALETKKSVQFVLEKELVAVRRVMDAIESSKIFQLA